MDNQTSPKAEIFYKEAIEHCPNTALVSLLLFIYCCCLLLLFIVVIYLLLFIVVVYSTGSR